eukprot:15326041-Alexandrium_andersonii.AAC.1
MSASLVGSEMCIRDRLWGVSAKGKWPALRPTPKCCFLVLHSLASAQPMHCLLYTSDAADDM